MAAMGNFGWLVLYTLLILFARPRMVALWRAMTSGRRTPGAGIGAGIAGMTARLRSPRDIGWGAALVPVTVAWLAVFGAFAEATVNGNGGNLLGADGLAASYFRSLIVVLVAVGFTLAKPRAAGYLAAAGLTLLGCWVLFETAAFPHYAYDHMWYGWLRDQARFPVLGAMGLAGVAVGGELTRRTIVMDIRSRRSGLTARVRRLTETRAVAVDSAAAELRRLERDLHDGAQARLVALGINLRTAEKLIRTSPDAAEELVAECRETSARALDELRNLVRGIYPPVLADRGLGDAVEALALDCPVPTITDVQLPGRPPTPVESAVYFAVAEAMNNAVKHTDTRTIALRISHKAGMLRAEIEDGGPGGAVPHDGGGLAGMERRLGAFDGILAVSSPVGGPTIVVIEVPCALSSPKTSIS
jgi:signal transduction histidine kinase